MYLYIYKGHGDYDAPPYLQTASRQLFCVVVAVMSYNDYVSMFIGYCDYDAPPTS